MTAVNEAITKLFDGVLALSPFSPWLGLVVISFITSFFLLAIFRYASNQRGIRAAKDRILAALLEVLLYRDDLGIVLRAQLRLAKENLRYLGYALVPLAVMILPVGIMLVQIDLRYGHHPLRVGERAIVAVKIRPDRANVNEISISAPAGLKVETGSLRMPAAREVDWRVCALSPGRHELQIRCQGEQFPKEIVVSRVSRRLERVSMQRTGAAIWRQFQYPGEPPLPAKGAIASIAVSYPVASLPFVGWRLHWIWPWFVLSMIFGLLLKGRLRVNF